MQRIPQSEIAPALALFQNSLHQMKLTALSEGRIAADVWVDQTPPAVAAVQYGNKLMIGSPLRSGPLQAVLGDFLLELIYQNRMGGGEEALLFWDGECVRDAVMEALGDKCPAYALREYYELANPGLCRAADVPEGYTLLPADLTLLEANYKNTGRLREEMCSERPTVESFLAGGFGVCAVQGDELAGWCLSEYNCSAGCEVGIEVVEGHRRRGLALAMVSAFAAEAGRRGVGRIGWHCFKSNQASSATARAAGFARVLEYGEILCFFDPALQYAVNGNFADGAGLYEQAAHWYARAVAQGEAPPWAHMRLAMALASLGRLDSAFAALRLGIEQGFQNWGWLRAEPRLEPLRAEEDWRQLF